MSPYDYHRGRTRCGRGGSFFNRFGRLPRRCGGPRGGDGRSPGCRHEPPGRRDKPFNRHGEPLSRDVEPLHRYGERLSRQPQRCPFLQQ